MGNAMQMTVREKMGIAKRLRKLRYTLILTQPQLGKLMGVSGVTICHLETNKFRSVSQTTMRKLAALEKKVEAGKDMDRLMRVPR